MQETTPPHNPLSPSGVHGMYKGCLETNTIDTELEPKREIEPSIQVYF